MNNAALSVAINRAAEAHQASSRGLPPLYDVAAAETFAKLMGWDRSSASFSLRSLSHGVQHGGPGSWHQVKSGLAPADYFRRDHVPVGIILHTAQPIELDAGLIIVALPIMSWRIPGAVPILIARPLERDAVLARLAQP